MKEVTKEMRDLLRSPIDSNAFKIHPTKNFLTTIKPIYVIERMNDVFGIGAWRVKTELIDHNKTNGSIVVKGVLEVPDYGIYIESYGGNDNGGIGSKGYDAGDAFKGASTDFFTKACSYLEIGHDVYKGNVTKPPVNPPAKQADPNSKKLLDSFSKFNFILEVIPVMKEIKTSNEYFKDEALTASITDFAKQNSKGFHEAVYRKLINK